MCMCVYLCTVEVGGIHSLRLKSLKLIFQPLHKCLVNIYSYGKWVRTASLCRTQVIFPTVVYRQIISLYHNWSGSEVYIH